MGHSLLNIQQICAALLEKTIQETFGVRITIHPSFFEIPPEKTLGDLAFPCFILSKELKKSPIQIASEIIAAPKNLPKEIEVAQAVGPYVNFFLNPRILAEKILNNYSPDQGKDRHDKKGNSVIIEFISPNTNKPLHIGHARNAFLGESIARLYEYLGTKVIRACLINDRGIHICKSMVAYQNSNQESVSGKQLKKTPTPTNTHIKGDHFVGNYYVLYNTLAQKDPTIEEKTKECLQKWEAGDAKTRTLWKKMNGWVLRGLRETFKRFNIVFDVTYFESAIYTEGKDIILKGLKNNIFKKDESGAVSVDLSSFNLPDKILLRANGTSLYITQEIYLAIKKWRDYTPAASVYVVASEQDLYFKQFFAVLKLLDVPYADHLIHLSYGMVRLTSGKIKSREGTTADADTLLDDLQTMIEKEIIKRDDSLSRTEIKKRAGVIALSAFKYYLLVVGPKSDVIFNPKESIAIHGKTGPYILYTYARLKSIVRKSGKIHAQQKPFKAYDAYDFKAEKSLIIALMYFEDTLKKAAETTNPSLLANYLYELAQGVNDYYHATPVLKAEPLIRTLRLLLITKIAATLKEGLSLLGISTIEKM